MEYQISNIQYGISNVQVTLFHHEGHEGHEEFEYVDSSSPSPNSRCISSARPSPGATARQNPFFVSFVVT